MLEVEQGFCGTQGTAAVSEDRDHRVTAPLSSLPTPRLSYPESYRNLGSLDGRFLLWIFIQQHFFFGSFILGIPMIAWLLEMAGHIQSRGSEDPSETLDRYGRDILHLGLPFYPWTVLLGVILLGVFLWIYHHFFVYMAGIFKPIMFLYALCFLLESVLLYAYASTWDRWQKCAAKWHHLSLGLLTCTNGIVIIALANAWMAFMMSPAGVDREGRYLGEMLSAVRTPFWAPLNVHRILASMMFSGAVVAAYAAWRMLSTSNETLRAHYDRMGHLSIMIATTNLLLLPFAGYWFARVIFAFRQRMGVTLMGGALSWPFVIQALLIGLIFMTMTYYIWQGTTRMNGSARYQPFAKYLFLILCISLLIWSTPHTLPASQGELGRMGGAQHPIVGYYGTMAAKNTAINTMILTLGLGWMILKRCNRVLVTPWRRLGNVVMIVLFAVAEIYIFYLGVVGVSLPAHVRVGLALPQFLTAISACLLGAGINAWMLKGAPHLGPVRWGRLPIKRSVALFIVAFLIATTMVLMGYIRSSVRLTWHITEIMPDTTPWAEIPRMPMVLGMILFNVALFAGLAAFIFRRHSRASRQPL